MIEKKSVMKTEVKMSDSGSFRYLLSKEWNNKKKRAMVIMVHPSSADDISIDFTTLYTLNNLQKLDYGAVDIVNIYPNIANKLKMDDISEGEIKINDKLVVDVAEKADTIIVAWGKRGDNSKKIEGRQQEVLENLSKYKDKIYMIGDGKDIGFHPLAPQIRFNWMLESLFDKEKKEEKK